MSVSRDRVTFIVPERRLWSSSACNDRKDNLKRILQRVFGIKPIQIPRGDLTIICRPSQFARFIILRNDAGLDNGIKELNPKLVMPQHACTIDVSGTPNTVYLDEENL